MKLYIIIIFFLGCSILNSDNSKVEIDLINDCFIEIVDTTAYEYKTLLPYGEKQTVTINDTFSIAVYKELIPANKWENQISNILLSPEFLKYSDFLPILKPIKIDLKSHLINLNKITKTGKYRLISYSTINSRIKNEVIGNLVFSRVYFNEAKNKAILVVTIKDAIKSERTDLILLEKTKQRWTVICKQIMEVS